MATFIFIAIALWFLTENFPETFGFIGDIFSFVWNFVGSIVMFFVGILSDFFSIFGFIGDGLGWLMGLLGSLLAPVLNILPDTPLIPLAVILLLGGLFVMLKNPNDELNAGNADSYLKLTFAWCCTAFNLGIIIAGSGHPYGWMSGAFDVYFTEDPMTLLNYAQWDDFAKTMLILTIIGGAVISVIFGLAKGIRSFLRTWAGLAFCCSLGYGYMHIRLAISHWLEANLGFIGGLINIPIGFMEFLILIAYFLGIIVFLLPMGAIRAINAMNETGSQPSQGISTESDESFEPEFYSDSLPTYVSDDEGNHYSVSFDGDFIYINLPDGRISTKWEYVKGHPYFDLQGKRFYPHS